MAPGKRVTHFTALTLPTHTNVSNIRKALVHWWRGAAGASYSGREIGQDLSNERESRIEETSEPCLLVVEDRAMFLER
ncbi:MAG: hypothetical protein GX977_07375 [Firmicutes bacterium]|nr:hypothetical protein [Bacillota bacterium]